MHESGAGIKGEWHHCPTESVLFEDTEKGRLWGAEGQAVVLFLGSPWRVEFHQILQFAPQSGSGDLALTTVPYPTLLQTHFFQADVF